MSRNPDREPLDTFTDRDDAADSTDVTDVDDVLAAIAERNAAEADDEDEATEIITRPRFETRSVNRPVWSVAGPRPSTGKTTAQSQKEGQEREDAMMWALYIEQRTDTTRDWLVNRYLHLVRLIADRLASRLHASVTAEDLHGAGMFGLLQAIDNFDPNNERGAKFETYCTPRIHGAMLDELRQLDWTPRPVRQSQVRYDAAFASLEQSLGREPADEELAEYLEMPLNDFYDFRRKAQVATIHSLTHGSNGDGEGGEGDGGLTTIDVYEDETSTSPVGSLEQTELITELIGNLDSKERIILVLYYFEKVTMKEVGDVLGISESRVSQVHSRMMKRLKKTWGPQLFPDMFDGSDEDEADDNASTSSASASSTKLTIEDFRNAPKAKKPRRSSGKSSRRGTIDEAAA